MEFGAGLKLVIFDFDGTLFHLNADWEALGTALGTHGTAETMGDALRRHRDEGNHSRLLAANTVEARAVGERRVDPEILESLKKLSDRYQLAVFTRNSRHTVEQAFGGTLFEKKLYIVGREDTVKLKPHPEGIQVICSRFSVSPAQTALVGDTEHDVLAAHALGVRAVVISNPNVTRMPTGADLYVDSIADLTARLTK